MGGTGTSVVEPPGRTVGGDHLDGMDLADPPAANQFAAEPEIGRTALLHAVLKNAARLPKNLQAGKILLDRQPERFFSVGSIFLRPSRQDGDWHVPVVGRGDGHGVDVVAGENVAEIGVGLALNQPGARRRSRYASATATACTPLHRRKSYGSPRQPGNRCGPTSPVRWPAECRRCPGAVERDDIRRGDSGGHFTLQEIPAIDLNSVSWVHSLPRRG